MVVLEFKKGDYVSRNSYKNDIIFKIINIKKNVCYLKGEEVRLYADSPIEDLKIEHLLIIDYQFYFLKK